MTIGVSPTTDSERSPPWPFRSGVTIFPLHGAVAQTLLFVVWVKLENYSILLFLSKKNLFLFEKPL